MKTYYFSSAKSISVFTIMGLISIIMTSCGSYKNSSYYDGDGIYGGSEVKNTDNRPQSDSRESNQYKDYFGSLQKDNEEVEIFTDVDSYNSDNYTNQDDRNEGYESGYSGWGSNPENITVTVYDNNWAWNGWNNYFYGPSYGWGWNMGWNSWYGPNYGWGWNNWYGPGYGYYGWGWNNYYNNYGYYNHHHVYNRGIRGSSFRSDGNRSTIGRRNTTGTRNTNYNGVRRNPSYNGTRNPNNNYQPRRNETTTPRNYTPRNNNNNPRNYSPRGTNPSQTSPRNYTPTRPESDTPRSNAPTRSDSSSPRSYSPSSGSSQNSGSGYGGGRSNSGGRR
jgi:hypothetical protein